MVFVYFICCNSIVAQNQNYPSNFDLTTLNGTNGFFIPGLPPSMQLGIESQFIGDINNDGLEDIAVGSGDSVVNGNNLSGAAYIIFGSTMSFPNPFDVSTLDGTNGFAIEGTVGDERRGSTVAGPGDINGDGIDDLIIGSSSTLADDIVIYGANSFPALITVNDINSTNGFIIDTPGSDQVAALGDVNGDGINDFIIGVPHWSGQSWVIFGRTSNFPVSIDVSWLDGINGFRTSSFSGSRPAYKVGGAGDVNNDGFNDILIGNWDSSNTAISYLVFGKSTGFNAIVNLATLDGSDGLSIDNSGGNFLTYVGALGDINNDGIDDFFSEDNAVFGSNNPFPSHFPTNNLNGTDGFSLPGRLTSAAIGDVNMDGIDDFISAYGSGGIAYIVFGSTTGFPNPIDNTTLNGLNGFVVEGLTTSNIARPISGNGDINGDGISDFIVGSVNKSYVIFGGDHYAMPLNIGYPQALNITSTSLNLFVNGPETGTIHYAIYPGTNTNTPDYTDIINGVGSDANGNFLLNFENTDINEAISALPSNNSFDIYLFFEDDAGNFGEIYSLNNNTLSTSNEHLLETITIYPNPARTKLKITSSFINNMTYSLNNIHGQLLQEGTINTGVDVLNVSKLPKGVYILSIKTDVGIMIKKIIKS